MSNSLPAEEIIPRFSVSDPQWLDVVERQVGALKFGSVHITVHESRVVQIETTVRVRFDKPRL